MTTMPLEPMSFGKAVKGKDQQVRKPAIASFACRPGKPVAVGVFPLKRHEKRRVAAPEAKLPQNVVFARSPSGDGARWNRRMLKLSLSLSVAALALTGAAYGQDASEDQGETVLFADLILSTIEVAGLRPIQEQDITTSITIIDASDLAVRAAPYVADQLRAVPGVGVSRSGAVGALTQVRIRGGEANHTLVLLNGAEVSDPTTGETDFGLWSGLNVERIEVARGEQSALYGSDAIGGVVSITTGGEGLSSALEYGSLNTLRGDLGFATDVDNGRFGFAVSGFTTDGVDTAGLDGEKDGSESYSALATGAFDVTNDWLLSGLASYRTSMAQTDPDSDFDGLLDNADRETESVQWLIGTVLEGDAAGFNHVFRASYNDVTRENTADDVFADETIGQRTKLSYSPSRDFVLATGELTLSGLIDWESEDYERVGIASFFGDPNQTASFDTLGLAGEALLSLDHLALTASVRRDDNDGRFDNATTWRAGAAYNFDGGAKIRASAGTGVKNPTFTELFGFIPASFVGNPDLKPEQSTSWEIGWDQDFGDVQTSLTYFSAELEDEIFTQFNPDFTSMAANRGGTSERNGIEASMRWAISDELDLSGAVSNISSQSDTGADEIRVPEWTGSAALNWTRGGMRVGLAADYVGEQGDTDFGTFQPVDLDAYWLVSATVEFPITDRLSLTLRGANLLDQTVTDVFGYHAPGAGVFIGLKLR